MTDDFYHKMERALADAHAWVDRSTYEAGKTLDAIADFPLIAPASKFIGTRWLTALLGIVDTHPLQQSVSDLKQEYPDHSPADLAHRIVVKQAMEAGKIGLLTNLLPPLAIALLGVEVAAMIQLQTEMTYKIAAAYGFDLQQPERKGEALAIFLLSLGAGGFKIGTNFFEVIPGFGAAIGATTNAAIVYSLGWSACRFYEAKITQPTVKIELD
jgi:uncharacterized protein (DUF697 family)